ncbi:MAG: dihydroorotate dehydrogenase [Oscillospiraceae bacterium]|jgi:dihydroorotate dehydrogenase (NAD+) catalytic subunit|nr:dihydroorotate dehydrogenase [Oscillospiraceae bacterium]
MPENPAKNKNAADLAVSFCGVRLKNPIVAASGTFGFGREYAELWDISRLGAISVKGLTRQPRQGNPPPRIAETPAGMLNAVGLQNPGAEAFIKTELPFLRGFDLPVFANISANTPEEYGEMARLLANAGVDLIEVNVSCPNVRAGGIQFGTDPAAVARVTEEVKKNAVSVPVAVKLSPNVTSIADIARAAESAGADGISAINTLLGMRIDLRRRRPVLHNNTGGLSGPAIFPVALRCVADIYRAVKLPICGGGGVMTARDAAEMMIAGAACVSVGTATVFEPAAIPELLDGLPDLCRELGVGGIAELTGTLALN